ncbi:PRC-barrel domain-containing protein [Leptothermofonsia sp. ETS-13]|uniref:PRC-barrel domain-containing protein n=1 Tax=Leptothermofonsia sp. ETS-13 TaxID=3035696 RepID=UPI003BA195BD
MTAQPEVVKQSELVNQLVINRDNMEELGRVEVLWMYAPSHRVLGFVCKAGLLSKRKKAFKLSQVSSLGTNGILTHSQPEETDAEKVSRLESVINCEIWSDSGQKVGKIIDYIFNLKTGEISKYLFISSHLDFVTGEIYQLFPSQVLSIGRRRVLVPEYALKNLSIYREGIKQKLTRATEFLKEEKEQVAQELKTLTQRAQETTQQAKGRFRNLTEQLKDRVQSISQEAKEKIHSLSEQLKEEVQTLSEQAKEKGSEWFEQMREQTQTLGEQVEDGIQTLTVQAKEILDSDEEEEWNQTSSLMAQEDPEDFFDALFKEEEETTSPSNQVSPPVPSQSLKDEPETPAPSNATPLQPDETLSDQKETVDFIWDDVWDDRPNPTSTIEQNIIIPGRARDQRAQ